MDDPRARLQGQLLTCRIIPAAMCLGLLSLAVVTVFLSAGKPPAAPLPFHGIMSGITALVFFTSWAAAGFVESRPMPPGDPEAVIAAWWTTRIVGLALREGSGLLGLVTCLLAGLAGALAAQPALWLNALPALAFGLFVWRTWPSLETLEEVVRTAGR